MVYFKSNMRRAGEPINFWGQRASRVSKELKEMIYDQYYSFNSLFVYSDGSMNSAGNEMAIACSFVKDGSINVEKSLVYPPEDCYSINIYAELQAIKYGLLHFKPYMDYPCDNIIIYSDIKNINDIMDDNIAFKKVKSLQLLKKELQQLLHEKMLLFPQTALSIEYLPIEKKRYNPFAKSAHNAAYRLLNS